jgi:hypothetical protein
MMKHNLWDNTVGVQAHNDKIAYYYITSFVGVEQL